MCFLSKDHIILVRTFEYVFLGNIDVGGLTFILSSITGCLVNISCYQSSGVFISHSCTIRHILLLVYGSKRVVPDAVSVLLVRFLVCD